MTTTELIAEGKAWLECAPEGKPGAPDLLGFTGRVGFVCSECAGRILARGCNLRMLADVPVWHPTYRPLCDLCQKVTPFERSNPEYVTHIRDVDGVRPLSPPIRLF